MSALLEVKNVYVSYGGRQILKNISIDLKKSEILGLVGESGSGKSTTARVITGLITADSGSIYLSGKELKGRRGRGTCRRMQMVFQTPDSSLNPKYSVGELLYDAMHFHFRDMKREEIREKSVELIRRLELPEDTLERYPKSFSGGQKQRIALARALCVEPEILIADEPTSSLDVTVQLKMLELIREIQKKQGLSILFISHDLGVINYLCDRVAVMKDGEIAECADKEDFFKAPATEYGRELLESAI